MLPCPMLRILIVDPHEVLRRGLRELLESRADWCISAEASNGRDAVKLALKTMPEVVLLDLSMPEMNGIEATRAIRKELPATEVLIFTARQSEGLVREALAAGAHGYLMKTEPAHRVIEAIESLAEHQPFFSSEISRRLLDHYIAGAPANILSTREREVIQLMAEGRSSKAVSSLLGITFKTTETHRAAIYGKLGTKSFAELVRYALRTNIIEATP